MKQNWNNTADIAIYPCLLILSPWTFESKFWCTSRMHNCIWSCTNSRGILYLDNL